MTDISPQNEDRIILELSSMRQSMDSLRETISDKFSASLKPIERALRSITLIPLALIFGGMNTWLFYTGKIQEGTWFWLTVFMMMPFFGDSVRAVTEFIPWPKLVPAGKVAALLGVLGLAACSISGCGAREAYAWYDANFDRAAVVTVRPMEKGGVFEYDVTSALKPGDGNLTAKFRIEAAAQPVWKSVVGQERGWLGK